MSESSLSWLIVGLGNPGTRYAGTWHNLGFMVLDFWAAAKKLNFKPGRGDYYHLKFSTSSGDVLLLKPTSYMNLSGVPVASVARYRKIPPQRILIICDDVALPFGVIRIRKSGSDGGHRGLASVIGALGTEEIPRMRIGIWTEKWQGELADHVLSSIPSALHSDLEKILHHGTQALECILSDGIEKAMNLYNRDFLAEKQPQTKSTTRDNGNTP
jgi:PTH1 family peptidyl-tRNA hydrolase